MRHDINDTPALLIYDYFAVPAALLWFFGGIWVICVTLVRFCYVDNIDVYHPCDKVLTIEN